jgi:hypothetical protein
MLDQPAASLVELEGVEVRGVRGESLGLLPIGEC